MKILLVSELIPRGIIGGLASHCITLGNHLLKMGHDVQLMGNSDFPYNDSVEFKGRFIAGFSLNWTLLRKIDKYTGVFPYPLFLHFSKQIADAINKVAEQYDVVHYHGHYPMVEKYIPDSTNYIQTCHDYGTFCPNKYFYRFSDNEVCSAFTLQDCISCYKSKIGCLGRNLNEKWFSKWREDTSNSLSRRKTIFVSEKVMELSLKVLDLEWTNNIFVIHNFTDTEEIILKLQKQDENLNTVAVKNYDVMVASTLISPKGVYSFLQTYKEKGCNFRITVVGAGSEMSLIRKDFRDYPVTCLNWLSHEDTLRLISLHKAFIITSRWEEPCPTTMLEAMFMNKSVFALKRGGIPDLKAYSLYEHQVNLFDSMEELVDGIANHLAEQSSLINADITYKDFGGCVSKKALEIISIYKS